MQEIKDIHSVSEAGVFNHIWVVRYLWDFGSGPILHGHGFPKETLDWRSAEYGIDPTDTHTLLHVILYEPWEDGATESLTVDTPDPAYLYMAADATAARTEKFKRNDYDKLQKNTIKGKRLTDHPLLKPIHDQGLYHPNGLDQKKLHTAQMRTHVQKIMKASKVAFLAEDPLGSWNPTPPPPSPVIQVPVAKHAEPTPTVRKSK
jgi:hypothetical protein